VARQPQRQGFGRLGEQLQAHVALVEAAHHVVAGLGAVIADAGVGVVDPVVAVLVQARQAEADAAVRSQRAADAGIDVDRVAAAPARAALALPRRGGLGGVELDDAGRGVAAEQRALRAAQHFHLGNVERRVRLEHHVLHHHVVLDHRDRLRGAEVEVDVAQATDVEAREDAAGGRFDVQAGHAAGQRQQRVGTGGLEVCSSSGFITATDTGTDMMFSWRRSAVTTMASPASAAASVAAGAASWAKAAGETAAAGNARQHGGRKGDGTHGNSPGEVDAVFAAVVVPAGAISVLCQICVRLMQCCVGFT
jgi:hypothetical protein